MDAVSVSEIRYRAGRHSPLNVWREYDDPDKDNEQVCMATSAAEADLIVTALNVMQAHPKLLGPRLDRDSEGLTARAVTVLRRRNLELERDLLEVKRYLEQLNEWDRRMAGTDLAAMPPNIPWLPS